MSREKKPKTFPVMEIFGPVVQGEGLLAGQQTHFIRLGGCDYRCSWCDSMFAVEPDQVRKHSNPMTVSQIMKRLNRRILSFPDVWFTFSGGNPAMHDLEELIDLMNQAKISSRFAINVETQATIFRPWLNKVDLITMSPKPPSAGNSTSDTTLAKFIRQIDRDKVATCLKVVVFTDEDYDYAIEIAKKYSNIPFYLQPGTDINLTDKNQVRIDLLDRLEVLTDKLMSDMSAPGYVRILPQVHTLVYGQKRGV